MVGRKVSKEERAKCKIMTPTFRVSYPNVFKPSKMEGTDNKLKYSVTMLLAKDADLRVMKKAITQAKLNYFGTEENWPDKIKSPWKDGDSDKLKKKEGYPGHYAVRAQSNEDQKPGVVDQTGKRVLTEASEFYPGCFARAQIFAYVWEFPVNSGKFGVGFILDNVQFVRDGEPFSSKESALSAFAPIAGSDDDEDDMDSDVEEDEEEVEDF